MADHSHSCSGEVVDAGSTPAAPRVAMCVIHLIAGVAVGLVGLLGVALYAGIS